MSPQGFTMYDVLLRNAASFGERTAVVYDGGSLTHKALLKKVDALATGLAGHALVRGERICILAQNWVEYFELYFACAKLGIIAYPINWRLTSDEVGHVLERARPRMFITDSASLGLVADWPQKHKEIPYWYQFGDQPGEGYTPFRRLYIEGGAEEAPAVSGDDTFMVISTAAVDVIPRGAALSHDNVIMSNLQTIATMGLNETDCHLMALPLFHVTALGWGMTVAHAGGCNVIATKFDAAASIKLIDRHKVTVVASFPPVLKTLLDEAEKAGSTLPSLRHATGLEFPETIERLQKNTKATFWTGFGQSETSGFVTIQRYNERPGAAGRTGL
ncbi:MAG: AMP-binding protein, partial [Candidatus Lambdaproteobacteria bacterium]|nr:AMP-binding protein [Candidatus Lambdaproteobacteria bacterium]